MAIEFNDNIHVKINRPTDFRFGPFIDIDQANATIPIAQRYHGLLFGIYTDPLNIETSDIEFYYYWNALSDTDILSLSGIPPIDGEYNDQLDMINDQLIKPQRAQYIYYDGTSYWEYLGTTNGDISDYRRIHLSPVRNSYTNESSMISDQSNQVEDYLYYDGTSYWQYLGTTNGNITDYRQVTVPIYGIDGIVNQGSNELTLGGFIIEPTTEFKGFNDIPLSVTSILNNLTTYGTPSASFSGLNAALYNMKTVLTDKVLFTSGGIAIIFNEDGTVYTHDSKPWVYSGEVSLRNTIVTDIDVYMVGNFGSTFSTYDSSWNQVSVSNKVTAIKIDILTGVVDTAFTFSNNNTYNGAANLYRCILINNNEDMYVDSNMFTYNGGPNAFYMHVLDASTGIFKYGRTVPITSGSLSLCIDNVGCYNRWNGIHAIAEDSDGRLYLSHPLSVYASVNSIRGIIRVFPNPTTKFQVDTSFSINFTTYSTLNGYNILIPTNDNSIIVATTFSTTASNTQIDNQPTKAIMKFDEFANRDFNFGIGTDGKKGIYSHTDLDSYNSLIPAFNYIREERPGIYKLYSSRELIYDNGIVRTYVNYLFFDKDGLIIEDYEGFIIRSNNLSNRIYNNTFEILPSNIQMILHPSKDTAVFHSVGSNLANIFRYTDRTKKTINILNSFSYYELITKQYDLIPYSYNQVVPASVNKNISLGYTFDNTLKVTNESFITKSFLYRKFLSDSDFIAAVAATATQTLIGITWTTVPANKTSAGTPGQFATDDNFLYYCYATNLWGRTPIDTSTW
jgi:hypothetical protein